MLALFVEYSVLILIITYKVKIKVIKIVPNKKKKTF